MNKSWDRPFSEYYLYNDIPVKYSGTHYIDKSGNKIPIVKVWEDGQRISEQEYEKFQKIDE